MKTVIEKKILVGELNSIFDITKGRTGKPKNVSRMHYTELKKNKI